MFIFIRYYNKKRRKSQPFGKLRALVVFQCVMGYFCIMNNGILYVVATPIGNLEDITLRAQKVFKDVDIIACEDTRVTKKLLPEGKKVLSFHQHSGRPKAEKIIDKLLGGKDVALVTDAGTPGISDPGNILVAEAAKNGIKVVPVPGASALTAILSVAGIDTQRFLFLAYPPHKKGREKFFKEVAESKYPVVYYESPHRFLKNLELLNTDLNHDKKIIVGRELTKIHEEIVRGSTGEILDYFTKNPDRVRGEFVVVVC